jgi:hypothetical protein
MAYCAASAVLDQLVGVDLAPLGGATEQAGVLADALEAARGEVDGACRRSFSPPAAPETRELDGGGGLILRVPDLARLDEIAVDGATVSPAYTYPTSGPPYRWIATGGRFPLGHGNVRVTGLWGFGASVPADVARAAACLAAVEVLERLQAERSGGVCAEVTGLAREEFAADGPWADRIAGLRAVSARLLLPYRRWIV